MTPVQPPVLDFFSRRRRVIASWSSDFRTRAAVDACRCSAEVRRLLARKSAASAGVSIFHSSLAGGVLPVATRKVYSISALSSAATTGTPLLFSWMPHRGLHSAHDDLHPPALKVRANQTANSLSAAKPESPGLLAQESPMRGTYGTQQRARISAFIRP